MFFYFIIYLGTICDFYVERCRAVPYKEYKMITRFGTNADMIIQPVEEDGKALLLAIDSNGLYLTTQKMIDSHLADSNRYSSARANVSERLIALGLDPVELTSANQHRIQKVAASTQKVNPLKAAKRAAHGK